jgi:hypothetical protein
MCDVPFTLLHAQVGKERAQEGIRMICYYRLSHASEVDQIHALSWSYSLRSTGY